MKIFTKYSQLKKLNLIPQKKKQQMNTALVLPSGSVGGSLIPLPRCNFNSSNLSFKANKFLNNSLSKWANDKSSFLKRPI